MGGWRRIKFTIFSVFCIAVIIIQRKGTCSDKEILHLLRNLCEDFKNKITNGNMCEHLCDTKSMKYSKCLNLNRGKVVFTTTCNHFCDKYKNTTVVIKYNNFHRQYKESDQHSIRGRHTLWQYLETALPNIWFTEEGWSEEGIADVLLYLNEDSNIILTHGDFLELLPSVTAAGYDVGAYQHRDELALLVQEEYVFTKLFQDHPFVPKLFGTCGPFYAVEYLPSEDVLDPRCFKNIPWKQRVKFALDMLGIDEAMDNSFKEPAHFCDIKENNFGISSGYNPSVKIVDSDMILYESALNKRLLDTHCKKDKDCDMYDCHGICNLETNICQPIRSNNNLQVFCENIFGDRIGNLYYGLLHSPPQNIAVELDKLLTDCIHNNGNSDNSLGHPVSDDIRIELYKLLRSS